jgi:hypothetical protein
MFKVDMAGMHPDQELEEYFASQLDVLIIQQYEHNWEYKSITSFHDGWIVIFINQKNGGRSEKTSIKHGRERGNLGEHQ